MAIIKIFNNTFLQVTLYNCRIGSNTNENENKNKNKNKNKNIKFKKSGGKFFK